MVTWHGGVSVDKHELDRKQREGSNMKIEKLDRVAVNVNNLDEAVQLFSDILGMRFDMVPAGRRKKTITEHANRAFEESRNKVAVSTEGLELVEMPQPRPKEGLRSFHLKVTNLEEARAEMKAKGIRLLAELELGGLKEAIYSPDDLHGLRLVLVEYEAPTAISAMRQGLP